MARVVNKPGWYTTWLRAHYFEAKKTASICIELMPVREQTGKSRKGDPACKDCMKRLYPGSTTSVTGHQRA